MTEPKRTAWNSTLPYPSSPMSRKPMSRGSGLVRRAGLAGQSAKRQRQNRERRAIANRLYPERPVCTVLDCGQWADDIHETLSRARSGGVITDPSIWAPLCRPHHREITDDEPEWAYEQGLLVHSWDAAGGAA